MFLLVLISLIPLARGQLVLGFCPPPPKFVENLDQEKLSGDWYVAAQSQHHSMGAADCQRVNYSFKEDELQVHYEALDSSPYHQNFFKKGRLIQERGKTPGELKLKLKDLALSLEYRVLYVKYPEVAVEYTCQPGAISPTISITVLHRKHPVPSSNLKSVLQDLGVAEHIPADLKDNLHVINHSKCH